MAEESSPKLIKLENGVNDQHIGEDLSSPNTKLIVSINRKLYLDEKTADIHFLFETNEISDQRIPAHKLILSTGSRVFDTMFYGSIPEGNEVKISNGNSSAFKEFLQFFYLDEVTLTTVNIADVMNLVRQYGIERCMMECIDFLKDTMTNDYVCSGYQLGIQFELDELMVFCERKISANAEDVLKTENFLNCNQTLIERIVKMDSLMSEETIVFDACMAWAKKSCEKNVLDPCQASNLRMQQGEALLQSIHFNRMKIEDFAPRNSQYEGLFTIRELTEIMQIIASKEFQPNLFTANPISYEIFTWDDKRIFECSLFDRLRTNKSRRSNKKMESFDLTSNKPLLLRKVKFAAVSPVNLNCFKGSARSKVELKINQVTNGIEKSICHQHFDLSAEKDVFVQLTKPLLIHPKRSYEIQLNCFENAFESPRVEYGKIEVGDLELNFMRGQGSSLGFVLLSAIFFNQI